MEEVSFADVRDRRGLWLTLSDSENLIAQNRNLVTPFPAVIADHIRDHFYEARNAAEVLCNFVAFENLYIDKLSLHNWKGSMKKLEEALGPLAEMVKLVEVDLDVYKAAIMQAMAYIGEAGLDQKYLETSTRHKGTSEYFDGGLKEMLDRMFKDHGFPSIPSQFVDSQGSVERVLFYANVQRFSGAPVRLAASHRAALRDFEGALPLSIIEVVEGTNALDHVQANVGSHAPKLLDTPIPPIFEMIIDQLKESHSKISMAEAIINIRNGWEGQCFRAYLWDVQEALASKNYPKLANLKSSLVSHLREFDAAGTSLTRWTRRLSLTLVPGTLIEIPLSLRVPRHHNHDYIGFIGRWLGPKATTAHPDRVP